MTGYANKAWVGALIGFLGSLLVTIKDRTSLETMTAVDWIVVVLTALIAGLTVYAVPNNVVPFRRRQ